MRKIFKNILISCAVFLFVFFTASLSVFAFELSGGYVDPPIDLSYLAENPPIEDHSGRNSRDGSTPGNYDLRNSGYVSSVKDQGSYGTCWAHAASGAMESNLLKQGKSERDLSEMHLAWFAMRNSDKSKTFYNLNSAALAKVLNNGGNAFLPTALFSRLAGPASESELPYGSTKPSKSTPEEYTRVLRLKDVFYLSYNGQSTSINTSEAAREAVKQRIIDNGGVMASYKHDKNCYQTGSSYGTSFYNPSSGEGHAILLIGWNDNYSSSNFKKNPGINGAWLAKNSWGTDWGTNGYFWISYKQNLTGGAAFVVEEANSDMKAYYYDSLGWCSSWGCTSGTNSIYAANVFKAERNENLTEIGFYTPDNNISYEINVYLMSSMPSSNPVNGSSVSTVSGTIPCAGYHTVSLPKAVSISSGQYFSVVVKFSGYTYFAVEKVVSGFSPSAKIDNGSFFSPDGKSWVTGTSQKQNACIKAFTISGAPTSPSIVTSYPPDAYLGLSYSSTITATGSAPITWSMSGNVPNGLSINSSTGEISGTPTKEGNFNFTVTATNVIGSVSKNFTMNVWENAPGFAVKEFSGYNGMAFNETLTLSSSNNNLSVLSWNISSGKLPSGLTLDSNTGTISGTLKQQGTFTPKISAVLASVTLTETVKFVIAAKPTKPSISISKFPDGMINQEYSAALTYKGTVPIVFSAEGYPNGLNFNDSTGVLSGTPTETGNFTVKVSAKNLATEIAGGTPVTKNLKLKINAVIPVIKTPSALKNGICDEEYSSVQFETTAGTAPITWTATGLPTGMTLSSTGILSGTPKKAGNFNITLKASNFSGKATLRIPMTVLQKPSIATKKLNDATTDKKYTFRISAKGTAPLTWKISGLPSTLSYSVNATGTTATITGTPTENKDYNVSAAVSNSAGTSTESFVLKVKGVTPKIAGSLALGKVGESYECNKVSVTGTKPLTISYSIAESDKTKFGVSSLENVGLKFTADSQNGEVKIAGTPVIGFKSLPITITAKNSIGTATKKINLTVNGERPAFVLPDSGTSTTTISAKTGESVSVKFEVTGTKNITFGLNNVSGFSLKQTGDRTAVLTGTAPSKAGKTTLKITATNSAGKVTKTVIIQTTVQTETSQRDSLSFISESESESKSESESAVNIIKERNLESLSRNLISELESEGYEIAAVLPVMSVNEGGMYDFDFEIDGIETGKKLFWFAFPNREPSDDDEIAEFYDSDGAEIEFVTEDSELTVSAWLNEGTEYSPIVAVRGE